MWKCLNLVVLQLTLRLCPAHPVHVKCFLQTVSRTKTVQFKQTIEMNEHSLPETISVTFEFSGVSHAEYNALK